MTARTQTVTAAGLIEDIELQLDLTGKPIHLSIIDGETAEELTVSAVLLGVAVVDNGIAFRFEGLDDDPLHFDADDLENDSFLVTYLGDGA